METITIPKKEYEALKSRNSLYEKFFRFLPESKFDIENYSENRIKEFLAEDKVQKGIKEKIKRILKSL